MRFLGLLLRLFSYLYHLALSAFLLGISIIAGTSRQPLNLGMLPFSEAQMKLGVFALSVVGLITTLLALTRVFKYLFPIWAAVVVYLMFKGFLFSTYSFPGQDAFKAAVFLMLGALIALIGAFWVLKPRRGRLYL